MRKLLILAAVVAAVSTPAFAGTWEDNCAGCHNGQMPSSSGKPIPSKEQLKAKFKSVQEFVNAAKSTSDPMMAPFKTQDAVLQAAANEVLGK